MDSAGLDDDSATPFATQRAGPRATDTCRPRYMLDYGSYARLYADGKEWDGRSGRPISALPPDEHELPTPLWLLGIVAGLTSANDESDEYVRGTPCRCFAATVDIGRASKLTPGGVAVPALGRSRRDSHNRLRASVDRRNATQHAPATLSPPPPAAP